MYTNHFTVLHDYCIQLTRCLSVMHLNYSLQCLLFVYTCLVVWWRQLPWGLPFWDFRLQNCRPLLRSHLDTCNTPQAVGSLLDVVCLLEIRLYLCKHHCFEALHLNTTNKTELSFKDNDTLAERDEMTHMIIIYTSTKCYSVQNVYFVT